MKIKKIIYVISLTSMLVSCGKKNDKKDSNQAPEESGETNGDDANQVDGGGVKPSLNTKDETKEDKTFIPTAVTVEAFNAKTYLSASLEKKCDAIKEFVSGFVYLNMPEVTVQHQKCEMERSNIDRLFYSQIYTFTKDNQTLHLNFEVEDNGKVIESELWRYTRTEYGWTGDVYEYKSSDEKISVNLEKLISAFKNWTTDKDIKNSVAKMRGEKYSDYVTKIISNPHIIDGIELEFVDNKQDGYNTFVGALKIKTIDFSKLRFKSLLGCDTISCLHESQLKYTIRANYLYLLRLKNSGENDTSYHYQYFDLFEKS